MVITWETQAQTKSRLTICSLTNSCARLRTGLLLTGYCERKTTFNLSRQFGLTEILRIGRSAKFRIDKIET